MPRIAPITTEQRFSQSAWGMQDRLVLIAVPATANQSLIGKPLNEAGALTVAGTYDCLIPLAGMVSTVQVHLTATIAAGTASSACSTTYYMPNGTDPSQWTNKTAFSGTGSLTSTTRQTSTLTTLAGEQYAWLRITLASTPNVTFTQAEYNGL